MVTLYSYCRIPVPVHLYSYTCSSRVCSDIAPAVDTPRGGAAASAQSIPGAEVQPARAASETARGPRARRRGTCLHAAAHCGASGTQRLNI